MAELGLPTSAIAAHRLAELLGPLADLGSPLYVHLARAVQQLVGDGRLPVGGRLPSERELAVACGASRVTVTSAYARLRDEGWAVARRGAGTWTALPAGSGVGAFVPQPAAPGVLDLVHAAPAAVPAVGDAYAAAVEALPAWLPTHGYLPEGLPDLRARIAERFAQRGLPTRPEDVLVTLGSTGGITAALALLVGPGDRVIVEQPTWPMVDAVPATGGRVVPVALDADDTAAFPAAAHRAARQTAARAAFLVPDWSNPTGACLTADDRRRLAASLQQQDVVSIVDETLVDLPLDGQQQPPFAATALPGSTVTVGSLSKSVWAGLRVGWVRADGGLAQRLAAVLGRRQVSTPVLEQLAACTLLDRLDGPDGILAAHRRELQDRRDLLVEAVRRQLPGWSVRVPGGGLVLWCTLPPGVSSTALVLAARTLGLRLAPGPRFGTGHAYDDHLRLPYSAPPEQLLRAVDLLAAAQRVAVGDPAPAGEAVVV